MVNKQILIDLTHITIDNIYGSISIYSLRFLDSIPVEYIKYYTLLIGENIEDYFNQTYPSFKKKVWKTNKFILQIPILRRFFVKSTYSQLVEYGEHDIVFIPSDNVWYTKYPIRRKKKVVVVHDQKGLISRSKIYKRQSYEFFHPYLMNADKIIAISKFTKNEILKLHNDISENKIFVAYNSVIVADKSERPRGLPIGQLYILYVNTLLKYKNPLTLIKAFNKVKDRIPNYKLVLVGKETDYWQEEIVPVIKQFGIEERILHLQNLKNEELKYCYEKASIFVTTSLCEGFGYTPIEAAICGCPIISSKCQALPETTQGKAYYYEPFDNWNGLGELIVSRIIEANHCKSVSDSNFFRNFYSLENQFNEINKIINC